MHFGSSKITLNLYTNPNTELYINTYRHFWRSKSRASWYYFYSKTNKMHQCIKFILFWNGTLHVSDDLSVHHQEFKTVHTATGFYQRDIAVCLLASLFDKCLLLYVQSWTPDDGRKDRPKHVECHSKIK